MYWMPDQVGHDNYSACFWWRGIDVSLYFSFGGNEYNSLFFVVGIDVSAYFCVTIITVRQDG